ncbi:Molybdopterin or thiamine biosynthesis adenylyltransferase [Desulfacinum hydrothermale DSM 13146]|uniref:Molybdopterin or thiamine biosynthesis adenylyltransferase n=1 Tax=Desulfacinum hydrothermale DSM 13146 TaxID=1121390 RepID=A0A1W1XH26_9BACT|nr:HesA/MoeB/ThiF family protein [Desulfacinum hydrothermale]SMC22811.1 Molybdopterin or thiamine biosynthesis adenylyltransferase [Desulfacinum hydrothermale DSM 13146]
MDPLTSLARPERIGDRTLPVIEDTALLSWALDQGLAPWEAQQRALEEGLLPVRYTKNVWALSMEEQLRLAQATAFVCGCGGLGGTILQLLARAGVGHLRFCDGDTFAPSNLNRQWFSSSDTLGQPKAAVAAAVCRRLNPFVRLTALQLVLDQDTAERSIAGAQVVIDAVDNLAARFLLDRTRKSLRIPFIHGAVAGWLGQLTTFLPESPLTLRSIYGDRLERDPSEASLGVLGPTAAVIGSLEALEAIRVLAGRAPAHAGQLLYFDGESGSIHVVPLASGDGTNDSSPA